MSRMSVQFTPQQQAMIDQIIAEEVTTYDAMREDVESLPQSAHGRGRLFLDLKQETEVLFGGQAGGMKSSHLLLAALEYRDVRNYSALILRRTYKHLAMPDAIMARAKS